MAGYDREKGTVTVMVQAAGHRRRCFTLLKRRLHHRFRRSSGPIPPRWKVTSASPWSAAAWAAIAYPSPKEMHEKGIEVDMIAGFRSKDIVILEDEMKAQAPTFTSPPTTAATA